MFLNIGSGTLLKRDSCTGFYCEFCEIFKNTFFTEHLQTTASENNAVHISNLT